MLGECAGCACCDKGEVVQSSQAFQSLDAMDLNAHTRFSYTTNVVHVPGSIRRALVPSPL
jgi:hypothetical protein